MGPQDREWFAGICGRKAAEDTLLKAKKVTSLYTVMPYNSMHFTLQMQCGILCQSASEHRHMDTSDSSKPESFFFF